jgi:hypothetical protein
MNMTKKLPEQRLLPGETMRVPSAMYGNTCMLLKSIPSTRPRKQGYFYIKLEMFFG